MSMQVSVTNRTNPQADTNKLESEIDQLVALRRLYALSQCEIDIVEGKYEKLFSKIT